VSRPRVLIIIQNLWVPFDRRVWLECQALVAAGYDVTVVCPKGPGDPSYDVIDGVTAHKYKAYAPGGSKISFVWEYAYSFLMTLRLVFRARKAGRFDVLQACNPPDIFWPIAMLLRRLDGTKFVFDHHDLCPELFQSRFGGTASLPYKGLRFLERTTHRRADHVISTNDSYRATAIRRGKVASEDVTVVRTGPDPDRLRRGTPKPDWRRDRTYMCAYLGVMGPQDGVDLAIRAAAELAGEGRDDIQFVFMGKGDSTNDLVKLAEQLGVSDICTFTGRVPDDIVSEVLSTADLGLSPDPLNPLNDVSTMNKTMEYMAFELPVVAFDLKETRVSADVAAVYVQPNDVAAYARAIGDLLADPERRRQMGEQGRRRVVDALAWRHQAPRFVGAYERLSGELGRRRRAPARAT
jgi:glycosyltransferase involved in cell wall biosynthesis